MHGRTGGFVGDFSIVPNRCMITLTTRHMENGYSEMFLSKTFGRGLT